MEQCLSDNQIKFFKVSWRRIDSLYDRYKSSDGRIGPQGIQTLCSDLKVPHTDVKMLKLAWIMKAENQGYFSQNEWRRGLATLLADGIYSLRKAVHEDNEVLTGSRLQDFYEYAFRYSITEEMQKFLDIESICMLLELILGSQYSIQVIALTEYLKCQKKYKVISFDQWKCFLCFFREISFPDLKNYKVEDAWPVIIDEFVECIRFLQIFNGCCF